MIKGFNIFHFMDKNDLKKDINALITDIFNLFTSWGKNSPESVNRDMEYLGAYMDIIFSFTDKSGSNGGIYISNIDIFIPFASGGKNSLDRGNHIIDYFATY